MRFSEGKKAIVNFGKVRNKLKLQRANIRRRKQYITQACFRLVSCDVKLNQTYTQRPRWYKTQAHTMCHLRNEFRLRLLMRDIRDDFKIGVQKHNAWNDFKLSSPMRLRLYDWRLGTHIRQTQWSKPKSSNFHRLGWLTSIKKAQATFAIT